MSRAWPSRKGQSGSHARCQNYGTYCLNQLPQSVIVNLCTVENRGLTICMHTYSTFYETLLASAIGIRLVHPRQLLFFNFHFIKYTRFCCEWCAIHPVSQIIHTHTDHTHVHSWSNIKVYIILWNAVHCTGMLLVGFFFVKYTHDITLLDMCNKRVYVGCWWQKTFVNKLMAE